MNKKKRTPLIARQIVWMLLFATVTFGQKLSACPIPVYQYALEHWPADDYLLEVCFAGDSRSEAESAAWQQLQGALRSNGGALNLLIKELPGTSLPAAAEGRSWMRLLYPPHSRSRHTVWQGQFSQMAVEQLINSPFRQQLSGALVDRTSVVWVLLLSGNRAQDQKITAFVNENIENLAKNIVVPEKADWGGQEMNLDWEVNFKVLPLRRDDPKEQLFIDLLLASEPDLRSDFSEHPLLFPVFGRGLLLYALAAEGINRWTLSKAVDFLTGSCSCQVKAANPGLDLLLECNWDKLVVPMTPASVGDTTNPIDFFRAQEADTDTRTHGRTQTDTD
jgi:hypothetical protein